MKKQYENPSAEVTAILPEMAMMDPLQPSPGAPQPQP